MYKEVNINGTMVPMLATASTPFRYKTIFHEDFLIRAAENLEGSDALDVAQRLAYVMAKQAEHANISELNIEDYYQWLDGFDTLAFANALEEIMMVFHGNAVSQIDSKKKVETQPAH